MVECSPGERLSLPPQLPHTPAASALVAAAVPHVELWCNDNSLGTFYAGTASQPFPEHSFDLRSPLGVTPAALLAMGAAEEVAWAAPKQQLGEAAGGPSPGTTAAAEGGRPQDVQQLAAQQAQQPGKVVSLRKQKDAGEMFRRFESSRRHLQTESAARLVTPSGGWECGSMWSAALGAMSTSGPARLLTLVFPCTAVVGTRRIWAWNRHSTVPAARPC